MLWVQMSILRRKCSSRNCFYLSFSSTIHICQYVISVCWWTAVYCMAVMYGESTGCWWRLSGERMRRHWSRDWHCATRDLGSRRRQQTTIVDKLVKTSLI